MWGFKDGESLREALERVFGPAVIDLSYSAIDEGTPGPDRDDALQSLATALSTATGCQVDFTAPERFSIRLSAAQGEADIPADAYACVADRLGGVIEVSRAFNAAAARAGLPLRAIIFFSYDETSGLWVAPVDSLDPWFEAVGSRYENDVCEQLSLYTSGTVPDRHAGMR